jgi:hypothetical protein
MKTSVDGQPPLEVPEMNCAGVGSAMLCANFV